jgi:hypothetical protein
MSVDDGRFEEARQEFGGNFVAFVERDYSNVVYTISS